MCVCGGGDKKGRESISSATRAPLLTAVSLVESNTCISLVIPT